MTCSGLIRKQKKSVLTAWGLSRFGAHQHGTHPVRKSDVHQICVYARAKVGPH